MSNEGKTEYNPIENPILITCKAADVIPIDRLLEFQGNLKKLSEVNRQKLFRSIIQEGFTAPFFVWDDQGEYKILDGHQRLKTLLWMRAKGWDIPLLPVVYIEAENETAAKKKLLKITSQYGEFVIDEINEWIGGLDADIVESIRLVDKAIELSVKPEDTIGDDDLPEEINPITKLGDLWELGDHRLLCGDSKVKENFIILLNGVKADLLLTDPPYNVNYKGGTKKELKIKNDKMKEDNFLSFLILVFKAMFEYMKMGASFYIWYADVQGLNFYKACKESGLGIRQVLIWNKSSLILCRKDYQWKHEPCLYGWKEGASHKWYSDRTQTTVIDFKKPSKSEDHPTMKPVDLIGYQIRNSSKEEDIVLDPFLGSGSTLIACEKTNRICYGVELDPYYCDVIVNRYKAWCIANNKKPVIKLNGEAWNGK